VTYVRLLQALFDVVVVTFRLDLAQHVIRTQTLRALTKEGTCVRDMAKRRIVTVMEVVEEKME
jgi:hypothetical protein